MSLNSTPSSERIHIGIFGKRNAGKSSLINAITGQSLSIVSEVKGTTTDPVKKAMEILPLGPVVLIDTPGLDDEGALGEQRIEKTKQILNQTDMALLVVSTEDVIDETEQMLVKSLQEKQVPYLVVLNKTDRFSRAEVELMVEQLQEKFRIGGEQIKAVSAESREGVFDLKESMANLLPHDEITLQLIGDLLEPNDVVVLVVPIDSAAPKGRLILPQQQVIRDVLEAGAIASVCRESELEATLASLKNPPRMVVTDSQAFAYVSKVVPAEIPLTSFSILMSRYKGDLLTQVRGAKAIENLEDGDKVLISEGCTHHRQCDDIGTVKMPRWIKEYTKKELIFEFTRGGEFPEDLSAYKMVVHCGGCTLNAREMKHRILHSAEEAVPITNYGVMIAYIHGILARTVSPFEDVAAELKL